MGAAFPRHATLIAEGCGAVPVPAPHQLLQTVDVLLQAVPGGLPGGRGVQVVALCGVHCPDVVQHSRAQQPPQLRHLCSAVQATCSELDSSSGGRWAANLALLKGASAEPQSAGRCVL